MTTIQRAGDLYLENRYGPTGVPTRLSFAKWHAAALGARRGVRAVNIVIVGTREGRALNRQFRGRDYATNVLSFPFDPMPGMRRESLGDLVICAPVIHREAKEQRKPVRHHFAHMVVHGVLHLLGHDHEDAADARRMEAKERRLLRTLGIPDPYVID